MGDSQQSLADILPFNEELLNIMGHSPLKRHSFGGEQKLSEGLDSLSSGPAIFFNEFPNHILNADNR
jgi:hypothetical protein